MKPQGFTHIILFNKKWPRLISKIPVAMVYSFGEVKPGCRLCSQLTPPPPHRAFRGSSRGRPLLLASGHLRSSPHTGVIAWYGPGPILW